MFVRQRKGQHLQNTFPAERRALCPLFSAKADKISAPACIPSFRSRDPAASCRQDPVIMMIAKTYLPESMISAEYGFSLHRLTGLAADSKRTGCVIFY